MKTTKLFILVLAFLSVFLTLSECCCEENKDEHASTKPADSTASTIPDTLIANVPKISKEVHKAQETEAAKSKAAIKAGATGAAIIAAINAGKAEDKLEEAQEKVKAATAPDEKTKAEEALETAQDKLQQANAKLTAVLTGTTAIGTQINQLKEAAKAAGEARRKLAVAEAIAAFGDPTAVYLAKTTKDEAEAAQTNAQKAVGEGYSLTPILITTAVQAAIKAGLTEDNVAELVRISTEESQASFTAAEKAMAAARDDLKEANAELTAALTRAIDATEIGQAINELKEAVRNAEKARREAAAEAPTV